MMRESTEMLVLRTFGLVCGVLLALSGGPCGAVTLDGVDVVRLAGLCAGVAQGLPAASALPEDASVLKATLAEAPAVEKEAEASVDPPKELSPEAMLGRARAALVGESSSTSVKLVLDEYASPEEVPLSQVTMQDSESESEPAGKGDVIERSLDPSRVWVRGAPRAGRGAPATPGRAAGLAVPWWSVLFAVPGLVPLVVSVGGILRNRPDRSES